jgi:hypothetical protein
MNVQGHRAVTDLTEVTGMAIVRAIVGGERDPARLAMPRDRRCGKSAAEIARYLTGHWRDRRHPERSGLRDDDRPAECARRLAGRTRRGESLAMESTSVYWIPIYALLESRGVEEFWILTWESAHAVSPA